MKYLASRVRHNMLNNKGFTLIEILVVLVIMGFLVAMVAPKLAGISDSAVAVTDDNSQKRLQETMQVWINKNDSIPPALANMTATLGATPFTGANYDSTAAFALASIDDQSTTNGAEVISKEFADKWLPMPHYINAAEAAELRGIIGGATMHYSVIDATTGLTVTDDVQNVGTQGDIVERYMRKPIKGNMAVMMIGAGIDSAGDFDYATGPAVTVNQSVITVDTTTDQPTNLAAAAPQLATSSNYAGADKVYARIGEGPMVLRIVMGMTDRNQIVNQGLLDKAGVSPQSTQSDNYEFGNYYVVLPRLQATIDRFFVAAAPHNLQVNGASLADDNLVQHSVAFNEEADGTFSLVARTPHSPGVFSGVAMPKQALTSTVVLSPEGDKWAANRSDWFGVGIALGHGKIVL